MRNKNVPYTVFEKYVAGIVLTGTEIKSIRKNAINLKDSFCRIEDNEILKYPIDTHIFLKVVIYVMDVVESIEINMYYTE